jgi:futalosine hydrolase
VRILIVSATSAEIQPLVERMDAALSDDTSVDSYTLGNHSIGVLVTGVGMVATAAWCARVLARTRYDLAINLGVCGSFDAFIEPGTVVHVTSERISELGAEDGAQFLTLDDLQLPGEVAFVNPDPPSNPGIEQLPAVSGITVNTVHGDARAIAAVVARFAPQVESMEGAAFMSACLISKVPFAQVRAVSNMVEPRNREAWKLADAIRNLNVEALRILNDL